MTGQPTIGDLVDAIASIDNIFQVVDTMNDRIIEDVNIMQRLPPWSEPGWEPAPVQGMSWAINELYLAIKEAKELADALLGKLPADKAA